MRRFALLVLACAILLFAAPAMAGMLSSATWTQSAFGHSLSRSAGDPRWSYTGASSSTAIAVSVHYLPTSTIFGVPKTLNGPLDLGVRLTQGGQQVITATAANAVASQAILGGYSVAGGLPLHVGKGVDQSMFRIGASVIVRVPLAVGQAGLISNTFKAVGVPHTITIQFYSWTPGSLMFSNLSSAYAPLPDVTASGSWNLSPEGGGTVNLVSPTKVDIDGPLAKRRTAAFTSLKMFFGGENCCDADDDGVLDPRDVCPTVPDPDQADTDGNRVGDACNDDEDADGDEWADALDVCPATPDPAQTDTSGDGLGDACNDGVDADGDEWENAIDVCPELADPAQTDTDGNGVGDACNDFEDPDGDERADDLDNCPSVANADQADLDRDEIGDVCDPQPTDRTNKEALLALQMEVEACGVLEGELERVQMELEAALADGDADGVLDSADHCPGTPDGEPVDALGCSLAEFCASIEVAVGGGKEECNRADWNNDEPARGNPADCKMRRGICLPY